MALQPGCWDRFAGFQVAGSRFQLFFRRMSILASDGVLGLDRRPHPNIQHGIWPCLPCQEYLDCEAPHGLYLDRAVIASFAIRLSLVSGSTGTSGRPPGKELEESRQVPWCWVASVFSLERATPLRMQRRNLIGMQLSEMAQIQHGHIESGFPGGLQTTESAERCCGSLRVKT